MSETSWFDAIPMWAMFLCTIMFVVLSTSAGGYLGAKFRPQSSGVESISSIVGATLGLLAFLLAFTFNMTANRFDVRKQFLIDELNAIETAYLRAELLDPPYGSQIRELLREYVEVRVAASQGTEALTAGIVKSEQIHGKLWDVIQQKLAAGPISILDSLMIQSINDVIDMHGKRVIAGLQFRIPGTIWLGLYAVAALGMMTVGYQFGQLGQRQTLVVLALALAFSAVIMLITDLDRAAEGTVQLSQEPMLELRQRLGES